MRGLFSSGSAVGGVWAVPAAALSGRQWPSEHPAPPNPTLAIQINTVLVQ